MLRFYSNEIGEHSSITVLDSKDAWKSNELSF